MGKRDSKPELVIAADWSTGAAKRWMARACLQEDGSYLVQATEPVGDLATLIDRIGEGLSGRGTALVGFDFPIGLPESYARAVGIEDFVDVLGRLGAGEWAGFYAVSDKPGLRNPFYPKSPGGKGEHSPKTLCAALGVERFDDLMRRCDRPSRTHGAASALFYTLGGKQVGRAAIVGWRDVLAPARAAGKVKIWPFDGELGVLLQAPGVVAAEIYPAAGYRHLGLPLGSGKGQGKMSPEARQRCAARMLKEEEWEDAGTEVRFSEAARDEIERGFRSDDDFDAMVALLSMLRVVAGRLPGEAPEDGVVRKVEGWILGEDGRENGGLMENVAIGKIPTEVGTTHEESRAGRPCHKTAPIILATVNARYYHTALGLRWLIANLGQWCERAVIREFQLGQTAAQIVESLLAGEPKIIGLGVYIWNVGVMTEVVRMLKALRPEVVVVLGGPEISYEYEGREIFERADYLVRGEGERAFAALVDALMRGERPDGKVQGCGTEYREDLAELALPYHLYTEEDIARRKIFVEASRGCPFRCEFCLSSLDDCVREFPLDLFLMEMEKLIGRGVREFIFVDRTFNLKKERVQRILEFFLERWQAGMHLHFEIVPDRMDAALMAMIAKFPEGGLHLEVGLQTLNPKVQEAISRRQDLEKTVKSLRYLKDHTKVWVHADLIIGLPGESWESFASGFDRLIALRPPQVQVGVLKRLKGAPIARHTGPHRMVYSEEPPYEILQNDLIDFFAMQRLKRFARYFDLYYNSVNFPESLEVLWGVGGSAFEMFMGLSDWIWEKTGRTHEIALLSLAKYLFEYYEAKWENGGEAQLALMAGAIESDYYRKGGRREKLEFLENAERRAGNGRD